MKEYYIRKLHKSSYDCYLLCLSYDSILNYIDNLEKEVCFDLPKGAIIIDQLLVAGNGKNRFISCYFEHGKLNLTTAQNATPEDEYRYLAVEYLRNNIQVLENSILSESLQERILEGVAV
jgi:hypothetical protein